MHVPSADTIDISVLTFEEALKIKHSDEYNTDKWLYVPDFYSEYRYILGTKGENPLICIGINPSTAAPESLDNTLKSVERIALHNGYDSFIMFNVYAQRATNPDDMEENINSFLHSENMKAFEYVLKLSKNRPPIWAAWGSIIEKRGYLSECVLSMVEIGKRYNACWFSAGKISKKGHPHHPLYLKKDSPLDEFDINKYCEDVLRVNETHLL